MAAGDLVFTDSNTYPSGLAGFKTTTVQLGEAVSGKMIPLYYNSTDQKYYMAISNDAAKYKAVCYTWESDAKVADDNIVVVTAGDVEVGSILSKGRRYVVAVTAGVVTIDSNLASGDFPYTAGKAKTDTVFSIDFQDDSFGAAV